MTKLIIFDWDDVFTFGATAGYYECYHEALLKVEVKLDPVEEKKRIERRWGGTQEQELAELLQEHPALLPAAVRAYEGALFGGVFLKHLSFVPGGQDFLRQLSQDYRLAIATGVHPKLLKEQVFPRFMVPDVFCEILSVYDLPDDNWSKPHPYMVQEILRRQGVRPDEALVAGDGENDMKMSQAAQVTPVAVLTGHLTRARAEELRVPYIVDTILGLTEVLAKHK